MKVLNDPDHLIDASRDAAEYRDRPEKFFFCMGEIPSSPAPDGDIMSYPAPGSHNSQSTDRSLLSLLELAKTVLGSHTADLTLTVPDELAVGVRSDTGLGCDVTCCDGIG